MRLVSQRGNVDLPYENTALLHNMEHVVARFDGKEYVMGKYSSEEKAYKVMEMLRKEYMLYCTAKSEDYWFAFNNPKVFQFPKDEEVEDEV